MIGSMASRPIRLGTRILVAQACPSPYPHPLSFKPLTELTDAGEDTEEKEE